MWREDEIKPSLVSPEKAEFKNGLSVINKKFCHSEKHEVRTQYVGVLATKPDDLSSIPGSHVMEEERPLPRGTLQPPHICPNTWALHPHIHTHMNNCSFLNVIFFTSALHLEIFIYSKREKTPHALNDVTYYNFILVLQLYLLNVTHLERESLHVKLSCLFY